MTTSRGPSWVEARPMADVMEGVLGEVEGIGSYIGAPAVLPEVDQATAEGCCGCGAEANVAAFVVGMLTAPGALCGGSSMHPRDPA